MLNNNNICTWLITIILEVLGIETGKVRYIWWEGISLVMHLNPKKEKEKEKSSKYGKKKFDVS